MPSLMRRSRNGSHNKVPYGKVPCDPLFVYISDFGAARADLELWKPPGLPLASLKYARTLSQARAFQTRRPALPAVAVARVIVARFIVLPVRGAAAVTTASRCIAVPVVSPTRMTSLGIIRFPTGTAVDLIGHPGSHLLPW